MAHLDLDLWTKVPELNFFSPKKMSWQLANLRYCATSISNLSCDLDQVTSPTWVSVSASVK